MNLKEQRAAALKAANVIVDAAKADGNRGLTPEEVTEVETKSAEIKAFDERIQNQIETDAIVDGLKNLDVLEAQEESNMGAKSLGDHFVKSVGASLAGKAGTRFEVAAPEYKAASDVHIRPDSLVPAVTTIDTRITEGPRRRLTIEDLLGSESISGNALTYFVEGALEGDFEYVAESGLKPTMHFGDPTAVTEALAKIAGLIRESDELLEDLPFFKSAIDGRLLYQLGLFIENALLNGTGTGGQIRGLLNRVGIQTETALDNTDNADAIYRAITKVDLGSGYSADGVVISPADYQKQRLAKDGNGQYFGGGFFSGQYGNGGIIEQPPLWGLRTVVTPAIAEGTVLVGSFGQGGSVISKGGVRVAADNGGENFDHNRVTVRAERRLLLAVRKPSAFVKVTTSDVDPVVAA